MNFDYSKINFFPLRKNQSPQIFKHKILRFLKSKNLNSASCEN